MAHVITINVGKGGCGKTALTVNTAYELAKRGYRVLVCDNDSQANSTSLLMDPKEEDSTILQPKQSNAFIQSVAPFDFEDATEYEELSEKLKLFSQFLSVIPKDYEMSDVLEENCDIRQAICPTRYKNIDIIPSSDRLGKTDLVLKEKVDPMILRDALEKVYRDYDFILIDNQAFNNSLTINAIHSCCRRDDMILIPIKIDFGGLEGWCSTCLSALQRIRKYRMNCRIRFVITMKNRNKVEDFYANTILGSIFERFTFKSMIRFQGAPVARASMNKKLLLENETSNVGNDYIAFVDEFISMFDDEDQFQRERERVRIRAYEKER